MKRTTTLLILALCAPLVFGAETPAGIDGHVYALDGITPVPNLVTITITNLDTSQQIITNPGRGGGGRYSVALSWAKGSNVRIRANNPIHESSRDVVLTGILHNVDLFLNQTFPELPPEILSPPVTSILEDATYEYAPNVFDWNDDDLQDGLLVAPQGMNLSGGVIAWFPENDDVGTHEVSYAVTDGVFLVTQNFTLTVINTNDPPVFLSIPETQINEKETYAYDLVVQDDDGDSVALSVIGPSGMILTGKTLTWTPGKDDIGEHNITVVADDGIDPTTQSWLLRVINVPEAPIITSTPKTNATEGQQYVYILTVIDPDDDPVALLIAEGPKNATIGDTTFSWTPGNDDVGHHNVTLIATDGMHNTTQRFMIDVHNVNDPPIHTTPQPIFIAKGKRNLVQFTAEDPDNDDVFFSLINGTGDMTLSPDGLFEYFAPNVKEREEILIALSDGTVNVSTNVTLLLVAPGQVKNRGGGGGGGGGTFPIEVERDDDERPERRKHTLGKIIQSIVLRGRGLPDNINYEEFRRKPPAVPPKDSAVYSYIRLGPRTDTDEVELEFFVPQWWLDEQQSEHEDIRIYLLEGKSWRTLRTTFRNGAFHTVASRLGIFAIGVDKQPIPRPIEEIVASTSSTIIGQVLGINVKKGTEIVIRDTTTGEEYTTTTGLGPLRNFFEFSLSDVVGHEFVVMINNRRYRGSVSFVATPGIQKVNLNLRPDFGPLVTGRVLGFAGRVSTSVALHVLALLVTLLFAGAYLKKRVEEGT